MNPPEVKLTPFVAIFIAVAAVAYSFAQDAAQAQVQCNLSGGAAAALAYEKSNYVNGVVSEDPFYSTLPPNAATAGPGSLLKLESQTNTSLFTLPPSTSLSRFIYQSKDFNGSLVPVSAYVLWPYAPRKLKDGYPVVAWAHGTSGIEPNCAPSHITNLYQHFLAPFVLATQGYVVVATDYAGLGVPKDANNNTVVHEYLNGVSQANDIFYSVQAVRKAFPQLSKNFVVMGHSEGGGSAWASAQRQAQTPVDGYLGTVALSPVTTFLDDWPTIAPALAIAMAPGLSKIQPKFKTTDIASSAGHNVLDQLRICGGCMAVIDYTLLSINPVQDSWRDNPYLQEYQRLVENGGKKIAGPMLIAHGEADPLLDINLTIAAVEKTVKRYPESQIEFLRLPNITHVPNLQASQPVWLDWIAARFAGVPAKAYNGSRVLNHARPATALAQELNWYVPLATELYETP